MSKKGTFHRVTEENEWEGETWYHYFLDGPNVLTALESVCDTADCDLTQIETISMTWKEAERLTNGEDDGSYIQKHWFGELTNIEGLKSAKHGELYKGGIRDFGEELFS